jgi:phospholipid/cholesterol/gamma-HCH transport system ATP-binding protein
VDAVDAAVDAPEPIIAFRDVWKRFGPKVIYEGLDLDVFPGETLTIIGGSGTGKSVMLKCLMGLLHPDKGQIYAFGHQVTGLKERQFQAIRRRVGMLFQGAALFDSLTVAQNVAFPLREAGERDRETIRQRVAETLELVGLPGVEQQYPADLSGGMQKRVGLARAIAVEPEVILYDEPTTGLDPTNVHRINRLIRELQRLLKVTSIVVTHDMGSAFDISNRFAMLYNHRIEWTGAVDEARTTDNPIVKAFIQGNIGD